MDAEALWCWDLLQFWGTGKGLDLRLQMTSCMERTRVGSWRVMNYVNELHWRCWRHSSRLTQTACWHHGNFWHAGNLKVKWSRWAISLLFIVVRYTDGTGAYPQSRGGLCHPVSGVAGFELGYIDSLHLHPSMLFEFWYCEDLWRYQDWTPPPFPRYWDNVEPGCDRFSLLAAAMATPFCICCIHTSQNPPLRVRWFFLYSKKWGIKTIIFRMFNCHVGLLEGFMYIPFSEICAPFRFQSLQGQISEENARPHCAERGKENVRFEVAGG